MERAEAVSFLPIQHRKTTSVTTNTTEVHPSRLGKRRQTMLKEEIRDHQSLGMKPPRLVEKLTVGSCGITDSWISEVLGLIFSAAMLIAIVAILTRYNGKPVPAWTEKVSLNAVISILSSSSSAGALYGASSSISQLKWIWFSDKRRQFTDLKVFDNGSRSVVGALELLLRLRVRHLAVLGAMAVVLRLAFDPFTQNLVHFFSESIEDGSTTAISARTSVYRSFGPPVIYGSNGIDPVLRADLYSAVYGPNQLQSLLPQSICSTGNCTWPTFATLSFCPICSDVSSKLNQSCPETLDEQVDKPCTVSLPRGPFNQTQTQMTYAGAPGNPMISTYMTIAGPLSHGIVINESTFGVLQAIRADMNPSYEGAVPINNGTKFVGTECALRPCVLSVNASVTNGTYMEKVIDTWYDFHNHINEANYTSDIVLIAQPSWGAEKGVAPNQTFGMTFDAYLALTEQPVISNILTGNVTNLDEGEGIFPSQDSMQPIFYTNFTQATCETPSDKFACVFNAVGKAFAKSVRNAPMVANGTNADDQAVGQALIPATFLKVHWAWLSLPIAVWLLSAITWLGTVWKTKRAKVPFWRHDVLPLLYIYRENALSGDGESGEDDEAGQRHSHSYVNRSFDNSASAYTARSEMVNVKLALDEDRYVFMKD